jgi:hypothetical protein
MADASRQPNSDAFRRGDAGARSAGIERWATDDAYWRNNYQDRAYAMADRAYDAYRPAYRYGCEARFIYGGLPWDDEVEFELSLGWPQARGDSDLSWELARDAVRDGFERARC